MNTDYNSESGETMKAAGLKAIDTVVESTATLIKSKHPSNQRLVDMIASRISGVISKSLPLVSQSPTLTTIPSCAKIHPLPIQRRSQRPGNGRKDHTRQTRTHHHRPRGPSMGGCQLDGAEREHSDGHGRADGLRCDRHISAQHSQFENRMIETHGLLGLRSCLTMNPFISSMIDNPLPTAKTPVANHA